MNTSEFKEIINATVEETWEVLFNQYGSIHLHNPGMVDSGYLNGCTKGELGCVRFCRFNDKLSLEETITEVDVNKSFTVVVTKHNLPLLKDRSTKYELTPLKNGKTEVKMISNTSTSNGSKMYSVKDKMAKAFKNHLFGLKYFIETSKIINTDNYAEFIKTCA